MSRKEFPGNKEETQHYDIFLSYSRKDTQVAMLLKSAIQSLGYTVFYDQDILEGDPNWRATIAKNINNCSGLVFLRTAHSVASKWCQREVNIADESEKTILPVSFRYDQNALPSSEELQAALSSLQTTLISDTPSISDLKNELQAALKKSIKAPAGKGNSLLLTEFINSAAENISLRHRELFEYVGADNISADISDWQFSLRWRLKLGDESANIVVTLNKFSKRPKCYANCRNKEVCPFYAEKDLKEYSLEAYLEFIDKSRKSKIHDVLDDLLGDALKEKSQCSWCGSAQGVRYFFREAVLKDLEVNERNDFKATLLLLNEAVSFYDILFVRLENYIKCTRDICEIFRNKELIGPHLNTSGSSWHYNDKFNSNEKIHFYKDSFAYSRDDLEEQLGILSSVAIKYPEALRLRLLAFDKNRIRVLVTRFEKDKQVGRIHDFKIAELEKLADNERKAAIAKAVQEEIDNILAAEAKYPVSTLDFSIHQELCDFIKKNSSLNWNVIQEGPGVISAAGVFKSKDKLSNEVKEFFQVRFSIQIDYHADKKTVDLTPHIISDFSEADEHRLSEITGFSVEKKSGKDLEYLKTFFADVSQELNSVHDNIYRIYKAFYDLDNLLCSLKKNKAATVLILNNKSDYINAYKDNETCWEYYLSPGLRMARRLGKLNGKGYPVMFSIRFESAGAQNATIGWCGDHDFKSLSELEKELFWCYVLSQFPQELRDRFTFQKSQKLEEKSSCQKNAILFTDNSEKEIYKRRARIFPKVKEDIEPFLRELMDDREGVSLMEQMFSTIEKAVENFKIRKSN